MENIDSEKRNYIGLAMDIRFMVYTNLVGIKEKGRKRELGSALLYYHKD